MRRISSHIPIAPRAVSACLLIVVVTIAGAGCDSSAPTDGIRPVAAPLLPAFDSLPDYSCPRASAEVPGGLSALGSYRDDVVNITNTDPGVGSTYPPTGTLTLSNAGLQGLVVAKNSSGAWYLIAALVDYATGQSKLEMFHDTTGDGLPDQSTRSTIASGSGAHWVLPTMDAATGTLYLYDGLGDKILRFADTTGDLVPESASTDFRAGTSADPLHVRALARPTATSVRAYQSHPIVDSQLGPAISLVDTDDNGVAESVEPVEIGHARGRDPSAEIHSYVVAGLSELRVRVTNYETWRVEAVGDPTNTVLATFEGTGAEQAVSLTRALVADEDIVLVRAANGDTFDPYTVRPSGDLQVSHIAGIADAIKEGDSVTIEGAGITGTEVVSVRVGNNAWTTTPVTAYTSTSLTITLPDLTISGSAQVHFRVVDGAGNSFVLMRRVQEG